VNFFVARVNSLTMRVDVVKSPTNKVKYYSQYLINIRLIYKSFIPYKEQLRARVYYGLINI